MIYSTIENFTDNIELNVVRTNPESDSKSFRIQIMIGSAILEQICALYIWMHPSIPEKDFSLRILNTKASLKEHIYKNIKKSEVYCSFYLKLGRQVADLESERLKYEYFLYLLSRASEVNFIDVCNFLLGIMAEIGVNESSKNPKMLLQEIYQKRFKNIPQYITVKTPESPDHSPLYSSSLKLPTGKIISSKGTTKKKAEENLASEVCNIFLGSVKPSDGSNEVKKHALNYDIKNLDKILLQEDFVFSNYRLNSAFDFGSTFNSIIAFEPKRYNSRFRNKSNSRLAIIGSRYLELINILVFKELSKTQSSDKLAFIRLTNKELMSFYHSGFISVTDLPFKGFDDFSQESYLISCIQALFGISLIKLLSKVKNLSINELITINKANIWVKKNILSTHFDESRLPLSNIVSQRLHSLGFQYTMSKIGESYQLEINHIKSNRKILLFDRTINSKRQEAMARLAGTCLRILDLISGHYIPEPEICSKNDSQRKLICFFIKNVSESNKENVHQHIIDYASKFSALIKNIHIQYLIDAHDKLKEGTIEFAVSLFYIHKKLELIDDEISFLDYLWLLSKSYLESFFNGKGSGTEALKDSETTKSDESLDALLKKYEPLSVDEIMSLWNTRSTAFKYREEAAFVLSKLRYEKGIDFYRIGYQNFLKNEQVEELELPSFHDSPNHHKNNHNLNIEEFEIKNDDTRERKLSSVTIRAGQSEFRNNLIKIWEHCVISGCTVQKVLDAAHISPYRGAKDNNLRNGLLLRTDIHRLFDNFLISINPEDLTVHVSNTIMDPIYRQFEGKKIQDKFGVSKKALEQHWLYFASLNSK